MSPEELLKSWHDDARKHAVIWCHDWRPISRGLRFQCQSCGRDISAWPVLVAKAKKNPQFHLICRSHCMPISLRFGAVPWGGHIKENVLPASLENFDGEKQQ